ncbi:MAG: hypothetical protein HKN16_10165 [Saprospiraceae bacterium]|nr:hypothetical protein [Saprospiraceae bacterium]
MRKVFRIILWGLLAAFLVFLILGFSFYKRFVVLAPEHNFSTPIDQKEAQIQDLEYLSKFIDLDRSFDTDEKRNAFQLQIQKSKKLLPVSSAEFEMEVSKAFAIADNGHTNVPSGSRARRHNSIPIRFHWFKEGLFTILAQEEYEYLLGKRIEKIGGKKPMDILRLLDDYHGGLASDLKSQSPLIFMSPEIMHAIGFGSSPDSILLEFEVKGKVDSTWVQASESGKDIPGYWPGYWLNPFQKIEGSSWKSLSNDSLLAIPLRNVRENIHHEWIGNLVYVQINENSNTDEKPLKSYLKKLGQEISAKNCKKAVLDLRFNTGGNNYHLPWPFIRFLKEKSDEGIQVYVITGKTTFSAGIITAAYAKYVLEDNAFFLGEPPGDRLRFWADGGAAFTLPNSKITSYIWTAYNDWENGCRDFSKCFWIAVFDSFPAGNLELNIETPLSINDFLRGEDSSLNFILSHR